MSSTLSNLDEPHLGIIVSKVYKIVVASKAYPSIAPQRNKLRCSTTVATTLY